MFAGKIRARLLIGFISIAWALPALAHVHPEPGRISPAPDSVVAGQPGMVSIGFSGILEPALSRLVVTDVQGRVVARGGVDQDDRHTLKVALPELPPAEYRVSWSVVGRDGHRTEGEFSFLVD